MLEKRQLVKHLSNFDQKTENLRDSFSLSLVSTLKLKLREEADVVLANKSYKSWIHKLLQYSALPVITKDEEVCSMISIPGSLSFAKLVMMSAAAAKSAGDARYASQDPFSR